MSEIEVSVIVTTKNEEKNIENCLRSVRKQNYPSDRIETIVVDNNSSDGTKEIAGKYTEKIFNFGPERSAQRNFGVKQARGKWILYLDADMILSPHVLSECITECEKNGCFGIYVPEKIIGRGFWIKVRDFEREFYNGTVIDCVRFVSRSVFQSLQGFDEALTGPEDWDFDRRLRGLGPTGISRAVIYHNEGDFNLSHYLKKKKYYAHNFERYIAKWGRNDPEIRKQFGPGYRYFGVFVEQNKWRKLLNRPLLTMGMYVLRSMVGLSYLKMILQKET